MPNRFLPIAASTLGLLLGLEAFAAVDFQVGDKILVKGSFKRRCAAEVKEIPNPGLARVAFAEAGCGDAAQLYPISAIQHLNPALKAMAKGQEIRPGDAVLAEGYFSATCSGKVKEISRRGYVAVAFDSLLCADTAALRKASDLHKVMFVEEAEGGKRRFRLGDEVIAKGIRDEEKCQGKIAKLTDNGFALVAFKSPACAYGGKLYSLDQLSPRRAPASRLHLTGEAIFQRVMREIASSRKSSYKTVKQN
jgi:hypothetical protein